MHCESTYYVTRARGSVEKKFLLDGHRVHGRDLSEGDKRGREILLKQKCYGFSIDNWRVMQKYYYCYYCTLL